MFPVKIEDGGTGSDNSYNAQSNLGLMKRYTNLNHLGLSSGYTIKTIFSAMEDNTYIEMPIDSSNYTSIYPSNLGNFKIVRYNSTHGEATFTGIDTSNSKWIGSINTSNNFSWSQVFKTTDFITGSFNMSLIGRNGTAATPSTPSESYCTYVKFNNLCYITFWCRWDITNKGSGYISLTGLPFKAMTTGKWGQGIPVTSIQGPALGSTQSGLFVIPDNSNNIYVQTLSGATAKAFESTGDVILSGSGFYLTE